MSTDTRSGEFDRALWAHTPPSGIGHFARSASVVFQREVLRSLTQDWGRVISLMIQGGFWLFILGSGFGSVMADAVAEEVHLGMVILPGVIILTIISSSMNMASSLVLDRKFGFLREMLVAPISRSALALGYILAGTFVAGCIAMAVLMLSTLIGLPLDLLLILQLTGLIFLIAFTISGLAFFIALVSKSVEDYFGWSQMIIMPLTLLSGALFPTGNLPNWLAMPMLFNPVSYAADPMRQAILSRLAVSTEAQELFNPGITWWDWQVPTSVEVLVVIVAGMIFFRLTTKHFHKIE